MKIILSLIFTLCILNAEGEKKDVDFNELFSQLDKVITSKKDKSLIKEEESQYRTESTSKREKNYKNFNEAAKKYHIFRASNILISVKKLLKEYNKKIRREIPVKRYSSIANKNFAYVSSNILNSITFKLSRDGKVLTSLNNYKRLLSNIKDYDIKTIAKVLIIVEQEIMNLRGMGIKRVKRKASKNEASIPMKLQEGSMLNEDIKVIKIDNKLAVLKYISS